MCLQEPGELHGVVVLACDPELERLKAPHQQERCERIGASPQILLLRVHIAHERRRAGRDAGDHVRVTPQVFRGALQQHVRAEAQRVLVQHRRECVVRDDQHAPAAGRFPDLPYELRDVNHAERGVRRCLEVHRARARGDHPRQRLKPVGPDVSDADAVTRQKIPEEPVRASVEPGCADDAVA